MFILHSLLHGRFEPSSCIQLARETSDIDQTACYLWNVLKRYFGTLVGPALMPAAAGYNVLLVWQQSDIDREIFAGSGYIHDCASRGIV